MSSLLEHAPEVSVGHARRRPWRSLTEHLVLAALLLWWALPMTRDVGGRGPGKVTVALLLAGVLLVAVRAWRHVPPVALVLPALLAPAALLVCVLAPSGWYGANDAAGYVLVAVLFPAVLGYARTEARRLFLVVAVVAAGLVQFVDAWLPWWSGNDPSRIMTGTFYWWNPFAAYLLPPAILGGALAVRGRRPWRLLGWVTAPLASAGIVFSSSRTCMVLLGAGLLALGLVALGEDRRRGPIVRWTVLLAVVAGVVLALAGPPFFDHRPGVFAAKDGRAARGETIAQNSIQRGIFWKQSANVFADRPWVGAGYHTLAAAQEGMGPRSSGLSNMVHNGYLQPLSDGGLLLGLPFLCGCLAVVAGSLRRFASARRPVEERWLRLALPVALGASAVHSGVDFDWTHPSDFVLSALLAATLLSLPVSRSTRPRWRVVAAVTVPVVLVSAAVGAAAQARWDGTKPDLSGLHGAAPAVAAARAHALGTRPLADVRFALDVLRRGSGDGVPADQGVAPADLRWAVDATGRIAQVDRTVQLQRAAALVVLGDRAGARALMTRALAGLQPADQGPHADAAGLVLDALGERAAGRALVLRFFQAGTAHAAEHLKALLLIAEGNYTTFDQCAFAATAVRLPNTPDPGPAPAGTVCPQVLAGAMP